MCQTARPLAFALTALVLAGCGRPPESLPAEPAQTPALVLPTKPLTNDIQRGPRAFAGKEASTVGEISAEVTGWAIEKPKTAKGDTLDTEYLVVRVKFATADDTVSKRVSADIVGGVDEFGNKYRHTKFVGLRLEGDDHDKPVRKGQPATRVLLIEKPIPKATRLDLDIEDLGEVKGVFRFTLPLAPAK